MLKKAKNALISSTSAIIILIVMMMLEIISLKIAFALIFAVSISAINFLLFIISFQYSAQKSNKIFLICTIGGMGIRLLVMLAFVFIGIKFLKVDLVGFIFGFFIWYVFLLIYEISIVRLGLEGRSNTTIVKNVD